MLDYSENLVHIIEECELYWKIKKKEENLYFLATELESSATLSLRDYSKLRLIKHFYQVKGNISGVEKTPKQMIKDFSDDFTGKV